MTPEKAKEIAGNNVEMLPITFLSHFAQLCHKSKERYEGSYEIPFAEKWFELPSNDYNPGLAYSAMGICLSGYKNLPSNGYKYVLNTFEQLGCDDIDITSYYHLNDENYIAALDNVNVISYAIGHREIMRDGKKTPLVIILVRGTSVSIEWNSNSNVANSVADGKYDVAYHEGFKKSAEGAYEGMKSYIERCNIDPSEAVIWIVAHSRGASIANVAASMFNEDPDGFPKENVYSYNFSSSTTTRRADANSPAFDNIFNVMNPEDYIARIPPTQWDFKRFGRDLFFPSIATRWADWQKLREPFLKQFKEWTRVDFPAFHGNAQTCKFQRIVYNISPNAADMYCHDRYTQDGTITFGQYFRIFTDVAGHRGKAQIDDAELLAKYGRSILDHFLGYFMHNEILGDVAPGAHQEEGYLAKLMLCYEMNVDIESDNKPLPCDTRRFTMYGPCELIVRDSANRIVAHIDKGKVDETVAAQPYAVSAYYDEEVGGSQVWIPGGEYPIEITAAHDGKYDCTWTDLTPLGDVVTQQLYADVPFEKGKAVTWETVAAGIKPVAAKTCGDLDANVSVSAPDGSAGKGEAIYSWSDYGDCVLSYPKPVVLCDALAARNATYGDHVFVQAFHDKKLKFVGWYENDKLVCSDPIYVFRIESTRDLEARFERR